MKEQAKKLGKDDRKVKFADEEDSQEEESEGDSADYFDEEDKEEEDYESESEEEIKDGVMISKAPKEKKEDANKVLEKA